MSLLSVCDEPQYTCTVAEAGQVEATFTGWTGASEPGDALLFKGDALSVLADLPPGSVDMVMTSPPYWNQRQYSGEGIGLEPEPRTYIENLLAITAEVKRVLTPRGSFWLNIGDTYQKKGRAGIPWRVALAMMDDQGWILRNDVV